MAAAGVLTACGGSSSSTASSAASAAPATTELAAEQVLNLIYTDLALIDVNDVRNSNEFEVLTAVQEGLFRTFTDENGVDVVAGCVWSTPTWLSATRSWLTASWARRITARTAASWKMWLWSWWMT